MPERFDENFRSGLLHCNSLLGTPVLSVLAEYFHDLVFADKFEFLNSLHFPFFFGQKVVAFVGFLWFFFVFFISTPLLERPSCSLFSSIFLILFFAKRFSFLIRLIFHFFFGRKVMPVLEFCEFFFELLMLFIVFFQFRIFIQKGDNHLFFSAFHRAASFLSYAVF